MCPSLILLPSSPFEITPPRFCTLLSFIALSRVFDHSASCGTVILLHAFFHDLPFQSFTGMIHHFYCLWLYFIEIHCIAKYIFHYINRPWFPISILLLIGIWVVSIIFSRQCCCEHFLFVAGLKKCNSDLVC